MDQEETRLEPVKSQTLSKRASLYWKEFQRLPYSTLYFTDAQKPRDVEWLALITEQVGDLGPDLWLLSLSRALSPGYSSWSAHLGLWFLSMVHGSSVYPGVRKALFYSYTTSIGPDVHGIQMLLNQIEFEDLL